VISRDQFWVLEFNARFGDPETQVLLPRMEDDFYDWCAACADGNLKAHIQKLGRSKDNPVCVKFSSDVSVGVVAAARGYPENPDKGKSLTGKLSGDYFFAGVTAKADPKQLATSGGRVFLAFGRGPSLGAAREKAYEGIRNIQFEGMQYRSDI
jgi:phosphoribosylamine--glycine ligase